LPHIEGNTLPDALPPDFYLGFPMPDTSLTAQIKTVGNRVNKTAANHTGFHKKTLKTVPIWLQRRTGLKRNLTTTAEKKQFRSDFLFIIRFSLYDSWDKQG
jgi:hypothetical protein